MHAVALEVLPAHQVLRDLAHRVRRERAQRIRLPNGQLVGEDETILLARADDDEARLRAELPHPLEEVHLAQRVGPQGLRRSLPRGRHEALGREVHDIVGPRLLEERPHREEIAQIALDQADPVAQVLDVLGLTPPAERPGHLGTLVQHVLGEVAADKAGDTGDEGAHRDHTTTGARSSPAPGGAHGATQGAAPARAPDARRRARTTTDRLRSAPRASARAPRRGGARRRGPP